MKEGAFQGPVAFQARQLAANVLAGARLALFLPVRPHALRVSALQFTVLVGFNLAVWIGAAAVHGGFAGEFDVTALPAYLSGVPIVLLTALLVALAYRTPERLLAFATALAAMDPVFEVAAFALPMLAEWANDTFAYGLFLAWAGLASLRAVVVVGGRRRPEVYKAALALGLMMAVAIAVLPEADPWPEPEPEPRPGVAEEALFHAQGRLIEQALDAVQPGRKGQAELYFVGFAPDATEDVFLREMRFVKQMFEERFTVRGRSLVLVSSQDALAEFPIASATNLARALGRVGEAMNVDEDVLFLFLTAHGDRQHRLSASQPPLELSRLTPTALARMLQDAGIRWRVIVVSACYSGGYIEPLRDPNTVVITAARADRISFGCESGRDFTYFGEAYFKDALPVSPSFIEAFHRARGIVDEKEKAEGLEPSQPQIWVGEAIRTRLEKLGDQVYKKR